MNRAILAVVTFPLAMVTLAEKPTTPDGLDKQLDGVWVLSSMERKGVKIEGDELPQRMRGSSRTFKGTKMILSRGGGTRQLRLDIKVDVTSNPKTMDVSSTKGGETKVMKCIYEIKDGKLRLAESDSERPKSFKTDPTKRTLVTTYKRKQKPDNKDAKPASVAK